MNREFYIGEDGLNYCATCKEAVELLLPQKVQTYLNMKTHPRQCACIRERNAREEKERKEREISRLLKATLRCALKKEPCVSGTLKMIMERIRT